MIDDETLKTLKRASKVASSVFETMEDGAVTPEEGIFLATTAKNALKQLEGISKKRFVIFGIRGAMQLMDLLIEDLQSHLEKENGNNINQWIPAFNRILTRHIYRGDCVVWVENLQNGDKQNKRTVSGYRSSSFKPWRKENVPRK